MEGGGEGCEGWRVEVKGVSIDTLTILYSTLEYLWCEGWRMEVKGVSDGGWG